MHTEYIPTRGLFFVGNGKVAMGGLGADIVQLFAPCYSMPSIMMMTRQVMRIEFRRTSVSR